MEGKPETKRPKKEGYVFIPHILVDKYMPIISNSAFYILIHIYHLERTVIASDLFNVLNVSNRTVQRCFEELLSHKLIDKFFFSEEKIISSLKAKNPVSIPDPIYKMNRCEWCESQSYILHKHHYPIPRSLGGEEVINICPNCHCEYHFLLDNTFYTFNEEVLDDTF
jgi:hypothetical protein